MGPSLYHPLSNASATLSGWDSYFFSFIANFHSCVIIVCASSYFISFSWNITSYPYHYISRTSARNIVLWNPIFPLMIKFHRQTSKNQSDYIGHQFKVEKHYSKDDQLVILISLNSECESVSHVPRFDYRGYQTRLSTCAFPSCIKSLNNRWTDQWNSSTI